MIKSQKKKIKNKFKIALLIIFSSICLSTFMISLITIFFWSKDGTETKKIVKEIENITTIETKEDTEETELINKPLDNNNDYWYYISFPLIEVNLTELKKKNNDTIGWINVHNTNINYPVVQTDNNDYYLRHSYDKNTNEAGWIYLDYRNNPNLTDKNNIIYGHHRYDNTMFSTLQNVLKNEWYTNKENHIIRLSTETENTLWQIISVYKIPVETYYIKVKFHNDDEFIEFLNTITKRSIHNFNSEINKNDKILTLSTCYSENIRTVVHAKLIKKEKKSN